MPRSIFSKPIIDQADMLILSGSSALVQVKRLEELTSIRE
jgi:hypothetical protein